MGFNISCRLDNYEYRGVNSGVSTKTGKPWLSLVFESTETCKQVEVSVPENLQPQVYSAGLQRGSLYNIEIDAVAGDGRNGSYSFVNLRELPSLCINQEVDY